MLSCRLPCLLAAAALLAWPALPQDPPERDQRWPFGLEKEIERLNEGIVGPWQLVSAEMPTRAIDPGRVKGYLLVMEGYLSLEVHLQAVKSLPDTLGLFFQTGTHRWRVNEQAKIETHSLIGMHNFTFDEEPEFQPPGERKTFEVQLDEDRLTLRKPGDSTLVFRRLGKLPFPGQPESSGFEGWKKKQ